MIDFPDPDDLIDAYRVQPGDDVSITKRDTRDETFFKDKHVALACASEDAVAINQLQDRLFAEKRRALLVLLQGMDTAGKSGTIKSVFRSTSPLGMQVSAFKKPTERELDHDYLWRVHAVTPRRGCIGVFDRSHYEDVLVVKVREFASPDDIERRYDQINAFEKLLTENGTTVLKFMLHVSREEQGKRLAARLEKPHKRWKFNPGDLDDRALWDDFMSAYEDAVSRCSTAQAPWHVIPSDSKTRRNATIARIVRATLEDMDPQHPDPGYRPGDFDID